MRRFFSVIFFLAVSFVFCGTASATHILATTFPVYQMVRNITADARQVDVQLMLPSQTGCPHDYALTPQDMNKLANTDILVINGLGMEAFLGTPSSHSKKIRVVDSSKGISAILAYTEEEDRKGHTDPHEHEHEHHGMNPHLFASPRMAAQMTRSITAQLAEMDPANAASYWNRGENYARVLDILADEFAERGRHLKNTKIVTQHGIFDYLARDMGLEVIAVIQAHETQMPSAADMMHLATVIKEQNAGALFTEPQYSDRIAAMLSHETGVPTAKLDPVATGPAVAPLDYCETTMRTNLRTLEKILGTN